MSQPTILAFSSYGTIQTGHLLTRTRSCSSCIFMCEKADSVNKCLYRDQENWRTAGDRLSLMSSTVICVTRCTMSCGLTLSCTTFAITDSRDTEDTAAPLHLILCLWRITVSKFGSPVGYIFLGYIRISLLSQVHCYLSGRYSEVCQRSNRRLVCGSNVVTNFWVHKIMLFHRTSVIQRQRLNH